MNQTALITGASSGIGRALAVLLRERAVDVFATGRNDAALRELSRDHGCTVLSADLAESFAAKTVFDRAVAHFGGAPDFLVNNAGFNSRKASLIETTDEELDRQWQINLRAPAILCREALLKMSERGSGHIVNVGSTVVHLGIETMGLYSTMKCGLSGLTKVLIKEARPHGVKVTLVHPGGTDTGFRSVERPDYLRPESAAQMIADVLFAPADVVVHELTFRPLVESNF